MSAQDWAIGEVCSSLICISVLHLKPLVTVCASSFIEASQAIISVARPSRSRARGQVDDLKDWHSFQRNHSIHKATLVTNTLTIEDAVEKHKGIIVSEIVPTTKRYGSILRSPDKVLIRSQRNSWEEEETLRLSHRFHV